MSDNITNHRIEDIYNIGLSNGALGGKLLGAGSGGFMLFYVPENHQRNLKLKLSSLVHIPFNFESEGSKIIYAEKQQQFKEEELFRQNYFLKPFVEN